MSSEKEIRGLVKRLNEHEKRISSLENTLKAPRRTAPAKKKSIFDHLADLKEKKFFDRPHIVTEIIEKLARDGYHYPHASLTHPLRRAVRQGLLGRVKKDGKWAYCRR